MPTRRREIDGQEAGSTYHFTGKESGGGEYSRLPELTGEDAMKVSLAAIAGTLIFPGLAAFVISPPLQQIGQQLRSVVR